jgi:hypothetical protein
MIPKIIHYCWFGKKPLPKLALKCIASWKKFLPDYEIKEWNEDNFDVNQIPYTSEAYACKKYAFVSDYARFKIMYEYGGIYFDTDVEVIKPLDDIISAGPFFGMEMIQELQAINTYNPALDFACAPGLGFACAPGLGLCKEMTDYYKTENFILSNGCYNLKTVVQIISEFLKQKGFIPSQHPVKFNEINFYPPEYFNPKSFENKQILLTENTHTIHHYTASWFGPKEHFLHFFTQLIGSKNIIKLWNFYMKYLKRL